MSFPIGVLAIPSVIVAAILLAGCAGLGPIREKDRGQSDEFSCITASNFSKCRIEREKHSLSPTVRSGRR